MEIKNTLTQTKNTTFSFVKQIGLTSFKHYLFTWLIFGLLNVICCIVALFTLSGSDTMYKYILSFLAILVIGIIFIIIALSFTNKYIIVYAIKKVYDLLVPFFQKLCTAIIERTHDGNKPIDQVVNIGDLLNELYQQKIPGIVRKGVNFIVKQIPFREILFDMKDVIKTSNKEEAYSLLFERVDAYIHHKIFAGNNMKPVCWLFFINIVVQFILIYILTK